jgi:hypothetical protein
VPDQRPKPYRGAPEEDRTLEVPALLPGPAHGGAPSSGAPNGGAPNGGAPNGGAPNGGALNGGAPNGGTPNGGTANGGAANGGSAGVDVAGGPVVPGGFTPSGLPVRVRQASLAAPLADAPRAEELPVAGAAPDGEEDLGRSPEEVRKIMASYQAGTLRGRSAAVEPEGDAADPPPAGTDDESR